MPGTIAFLLPSQFLRKVAKDDSLNGAIPAPVVVKNGQPVGIYFPEGTTIPEQYAGGVKWNLPKSVALNQVCGEGISVTQGEDGVQNLVSAKDGALLALETTIKVSRVYEVLGDLDKRSGGVETDLSVVIHGSVSHGVTVKSKGDVEIRGLVEDAIIAADGNITAKGGVAGGGASRLTAGKDIFCQFAQNATIEGAGAVMIEAYIMNSTVLCGKKALLRNGAFMVGGKVIAMEGMEAGRIGSEAAITSEIELGKNPFFKVQHEIAGKNVARIERELEVLRTSLFHCQTELNGMVEFNEEDSITSLFLAAEAFKREDKNMDDEARLTLEKFGGNILVFIQKLEEYKVEKVTLEGLSKSGTSNFLATARLKVSGVTHPGTLVRMGDAMLKLDREQDGAEFIYKAAEGDRKVGEIIVRYP